MLTQIFKTINIPLSKQDMLTNISFNLKEIIMSYNFIKAEQTTATKTTTGVIIWSNPNVDVQITSEGKVLKDGELLQPKDTRYKPYSIYIKSGEKWIAYSAGFNSLYSRMVLGVKLGTKTIKLKDSIKGYLEGNIEVVTLHYNARTKGVDTKVHKELSNIKPKAQETPMKDLLDEQINTQAEQKLFYTLYEAKDEHTTEDGAVFPTKELAEWHQEKVSKGKGNAQVVLDYNGGYVLAEQIYLQEVVYNKAKPYTNFIDVLNNNQGIVSVVQDEHCKFDKLDNEHGFRSEICFMTLRKQLPEQVSKHQAQKIQGALERYSDSVKALDESIVGLEALLKQVK